MTDLRGALQAAEDAAREAGALLRKESHRPEGPRGHGHHADVDREAEVLIRARLLDAFPSWSYHGEETGTHFGAHRDTFWLVDPNDGTAAFLAGYRASAVSIALIRDGQPVLGVVYAPCYPDDGGDFISWAQACGPPCRNGAVVWGPPPADRLSGHAVVVVSHHADRSPSDNLRGCAPARYRALPSIAYRLAMVAVGEGDAAISLAAPRALDVAGGHALLRAVGGDLFDERGEAIRYPSVGEGQSQRCFGGARAPCAALAAFDWNQVFRRAPAADGFPVHLTVPRRALDAGLLSRAQGCLLGQLCGDSLGSLVEFQSPDQIRKAFPNGPRSLADGGTFNLIAGQPTDDSELALALARSLTARSGFEETAVFAAYRAWYDSDPFDCGQTTARAFSRSQDRSEDASDVTVAWRRVLSTNQESQANGALMRVSPIALASWRDPDRAAAWAAADALLSHPHAVCQEASAVFVRAVAAGLNGASRQEMYRCALEAATVHTRDALQRAASAPPPDFMRQQGWVLIALQNAFYRLLHAESLTDAVVDTVREGGDTDTNAAIAGALAGAFFGRDAVPAQWRRMVLTCRPDAAFQASKERRPAVYWPVDAFELAERLLHVANP